LEGRIASKKQRGGGIGGGEKSEQRNREAATSGINREVAAESPEILN
jgi:hypothetical protein